MEIGTRFSGGDINFVAAERIAAGQYKLTAETAGVVGNEYIGPCFRSTTSGNAAGACLTF